MEIEENLKNNICKFVQLSLLRSEQIDAILPYFIHKLKIIGKSEQNKVEKSVKEKIQTSEFLDQFVPVIVENFTQDEVQTLIDFYADATVQKYFSNGISVCISLPVVLSEWIQGGNWKASSEKIMKVDDSKRKDIHELIRKAMLKVDQIRAILLQFMQTIESSHQVTIEILEKRALNYLYGDEFLEKYAEPIDQLFSHEEIKKLVSYYSDRAIEKHFEKSPILAQKVYPELGKLISQMK